jgi:hypothetical protein
MYICSHLDGMDDDVYDDEILDIENDGEEQFQVQSSENDKNFVFVNTRIDYQYRSDLLKNMCLYDFVSTLYKKKMNTTDMKYLSEPVAPRMTTLIEEVDHRTNAILFKLNTHRQQHI